MSHLKQFQQEEKVERSEYTKDLLSKIEKESTKPLEVILRDPDFKSSKIFENPPGLAEKLLRMKSFD